MKIQYQTKFLDKEKKIRGNCMMTTYACYFDLDVTAVPNIEDLFDSKPTGFWFSVLSLWLKQYCYKEEKYYENDPYLTEGFKDYYFACGSTNRGTKHQVIYKEGKLFHDPYPLGEGLIKPDYFITLVDLKN